MFGPLVASHFICDVLAFKTGTVLPDVNADCFPSQCKLQIYFHVEEKDEFSIFLCELYFGLSRVFFSSLKNLGDAKLERAYSGAACTVTLEKSGTPNVFPVGHSLPHRIRTIYCCNLKYSSKAACTPDFGYYGALHDAVGLGKKMRIHVKRCLIRSAAG